MVLNKVYDELSSVRHQLDNQIALLGNIKKIEFAPTLEILCEYVTLKARFGDGESACMAYCRYTSNIIGSSNLRDIKNYCSNHGIIYLTTLDFLYYAWYRKKMTEKECEKFMNEVRAKGSRLPKIETITRYAPNVEL